MKETRCTVPGNLVHRDEQDNLYYSNWIWPVGASLIQDKKDTCVLRIPAGEDRFDPNWELSFQELSGHEGGMFSYLGDGRALVSVFDDSLSEFDEKTDAYELAGRQQWKIWDVDLETMTGEPIDSIPANVGAYTPMVLDGRTFLLVPMDTEWTTQKLYELNGKEAQERFSVPGWSYAFVKIH